MALTLKSPPSMYSLSSDLSPAGKKLFLGSRGGDHVNLSAQMITPRSRVAYINKHQEDHHHAADNETGAKGNIWGQKLDCDEDFGTKEKIMEENPNNPAMLLGGTKLKKRPARLVLPEYFPGQEFCDQKGRKLEKKEFEVEGKEFCLAAKKGRRDVMEDGYGVLLDVMGDPKQAFFVVIDGHGGRAATDYVAENLGKNIVKAIQDDEEHRLEEAIRGGYLVTDNEFLNQGVSSGACAASVLLKDGELVVANVGDCRVVMSRRGEAHALTNDHRLSRDDERLRIENSGGFVDCRNGVWRVQGSLAVSRAIGDQHLKQWIISEPETKRLPLTSDCDFLIIASDGLWDKVDDQEAVDVVVNESNSKKGCKKLVEMSSSRGNMDDISVMVIDLHTFITTTGSQ
ncbi:hypothetical protein UlMin_021370 [Ulmus minor]